MLRYRPFPFDSVLFMCDSERPGSVLSGEPLALCAGSETDGALVAAWQRRILEAHADNISFFVPEPRTPKRTVSPVTANPVAKGRGRFFWGRLRFALRASPGG